VGHRNISIIDRLLGLVIYLNRLLGLVICLEVYKSLGC
jgi:hypothetical protein